MQGEVWQGTCSPGPLQLNHKGLPRTLKCLANRALVKLGVSITQQVDKRDYRNQKKQAKITSAFGQENISAEMMMYDAPWEKMKESYQDDSTPYPHNKQCASVAGLCRR